MSKSRLEAFSDGVIAILITIMVLELKVPHGADFASLRPLLPVFLSYILSFVYLAIYWNNHHHLFHAATKVNGTIMWANLHLLFWLSLVPVLTGWLGENHLAVVPTLIYGVNLFMAAIAYWLLQNVIIRSEGSHSHLARAVGSDFKGKISLAIYFSSILLATVKPVISQLLFCLVAIIWLVPDPRIERR